jgi:hypothetical protein
MKRKLPALLAVLSGIVLAYPCSLQASSAEEKLEQINRLPEKARTKTLERS